MSDKPPGRPGYDRLDHSASLTLSRREFLGFMGAALAASACGSFEQESAPRAPLLPSNPFKLGVASGDPTSDGIVLWTRLAPEPVDGGGMPDERVPVIWEISRRADFYDIETYGWAWADPQWGHSIHLDASGLEPNTWYYYRFRVGSDWVSPVGRTRTFPRPGDSPERLRVATASCQNYRHGYYHAHRFMADEDVDLVAFLGDYIYESGVTGGVRDHDGPRPTTLEGFRNRYGLYKSDRDLQAAHHAFPWVLTWDDHEVVNNYADVEIRGASSVEEARAVRAAAYQAYYEHMPLRIPSPDEPADMQIYRRLQFGDLVNLIVLDGRQYRTEQGCDGEIGPSCPELFEPERTMLGAEQRAWLEASLRSSQTTWNGLLQQTVFGSLNLGGGVANPDQWDGYAHERQRLLSLFAEAQVNNVVVHTGDIHTGIFFTLHEEADDFDSPVVGVECVSTSISSNGIEEMGFPVETIERVVDRMKNILHFDRQRGYCVCEYTPEKMRVEYRTVSTVKERRAELATNAVLEVSADTLEIEKLVLQRLRD
jgi:alkaline phosphatase D